MTSLWPYLLLLLVPLPIGTDRRRRRFPWVTATLIVANTIVFLWTQIYTQLHPGVDIFGQYGFLPATPNLGHLFISLFLHVSFGHLFWNMAFLWLFGPHVEDALGPVSFLALYLGGGLAAGVLHTAIKWLVPAERYTLGEPLVGASGAISAIIAPFAVRYHRAQIRLLWIPGLLARNDWARLEVPALAGLALWLLETLAGAVKSIIMPSEGGTAYWAHMGGFAFGLIASELGGLLREGRQEYLLQEARAAAQSFGKQEASVDWPPPPAGRSEAEARTIMAAKYHAFLDQSPNSVGVRLEFVRALAETAPPEAVNELMAGIRIAERTHRWPDAIRLYAEAQALKLPLPLRPRERLRLSAAAEDAGQETLALSLLRLIITETPDAPEDEIARLRLGQRLLTSDPAEARTILSGFLERYPHSAWMPRVREMLRRTDVAEPSDER